MPCNRCICFGLLVGSEALNSSTKRNRTLFVLRRSAGRREGWREKRADERRSSRSSSSSFTAKSLTARREGVEVGCFFGRCSIGTQVSHRLSSHSKVSQSHHEALQLVLERFRRGSGRRVELRLEVNHVVVLFQSLRRSTSARRIGEGRQRRTSAAAGWISVVSFDCSEGRRSALLIARQDSSPHRPHHDSARSPHRSVPLTEQGQPATPLPASHIPRTHEALPLSLTHALPFTLNPILCLPNLQLRHRFIVRLLQLPLRRDERLRGFGLSRFTSLCATIIS